MEKIKLRNFITECMYKRTKYFIRKHKLTCKLRVFPLHIRNNARASVDFKSRQVKFSTFRALMDYVRSDRRKSPKYVVASESGKNRSRNNNVTYK